MPFQINEAPNLAITYLNNNTAERNCCCCWTSFCCIPTFGISIGCCDSPEDQDQEYTGCGYPKPLSSQEKAALRALLDTLHSLIIDKSKVPKESKSELKDDDLIKGQVSNTIRVLEKAIDVKILKHGYLKAVHESIEIIKTRFENEAIFKNSIKYESHITGYT